MPDIYSGERTKLKVFLTQCRLYLYFNDEKFPTHQHEVLWMITFLRGTAFDWVEPYLTDHLTNHSGAVDNRKPETRDLIDDTLV
jgi:hypothetical protein